MPIWAESVPALMALTGLGCVISGFMAGRRRVDFYHRLAPFQPTLGDEAETWLHHRNVESG